MLVSLNHGAWGEDEMKIQLAARLLSAALLCAALAACSFDERIADHAVKYNKTVEEANNSLLLLNILRARDRRPMHFTAISQVRGSLTQSSSGSIGLTIPFGGDASNTFPLTPSLSLSQSTSPSFDVAVLDKQEFIRGILSPIEISIFKFYLDQRWPPEILLHLFVHKVTVSMGSWTKSKEYAAGSLIRADGFVLLALNKGKSGKQEPKWSTDANPKSGQEDGEIFWIVYEERWSSPFTTWDTSTSYKDRETIFENGLIWRSSEGESGTKEPDWLPTRGATVKDGEKDGDLIWTAQPANLPLVFQTWTEEEPGWSLPVKTWSNEESYNPGDTIFANGLVWQSSGGKSGGTRPDWPSNPGATVKDKNIYWMAQPNLMNAPAPKKDIQFRIFQVWVERIRKKVSSGESKSGRPIGPPLDITGEKALKQLVNAEEAKLRLVKVSVEPGTEPPTRYQLCKITSSTILCIGQCPKTDSEKKCRNAGKKSDPAAAGTAIAPANDGAGILSAKMSKPPDEPAGKFEQQDFLFHLRSVQGIMYYLGELLRYQRGSEQTVFAKKGKRGKKKRVLFKLTDDKASAEKPFVSTTYEDKTYYLAKPPEGTQSRAGLVLALVSQLLGLHKKSEELPTTTTVTTVGGTP